MHRELTIERRGELYHLRFHNYMGPWEGHQIEKLLDLEEVPAPPDGTSYEEVLDANQAYLWHAMDFDPDLHALVTEDRLPRVAQIVRDRQVEVLEGIGQGPLGGQLISRQGGEKGIADNERSLPAAAGAHKEEQEQGQDSNRAHHRPVYARRETGSRSPLTPLCRLPTIEN